MISEELTKVIRSIPDFPKKGILFRDITPVLLDQSLVTKVIFEFLENTPDGIDAVCGIESRGFLFGMMIANKLKVPFIPVRKEGKLPGDILSYAYNLEYGSATVEMHKGDIKPGQKVLVHDDLLATGGTAEASGELVKRQGATVASFSFLVELEGLNGRDRLKQYSGNIYSMVSYK